MPLLRATSSIFMKLVKIYKGSRKWFGYNTSIFWQRIKKWGLINLSYIGKYPKVVTLTGITTVDEYKILHCFFEEKDINGLFNTIVWQKKYLIFSLIFLFLCTEYVQQYWIHPYTTQSHWLECIYKWSTFLSLIQMLSTMVEWQSRSTFLSQISLFNHFFI